MGKVLIPDFGRDPYDRKENLKRERAYYEAEAKAVLNLAIERTTKHIISCYPKFERWPAESRFWFTRPKHTFYSDMVEKFAAEVNSITCVCNDGVQRTFEIKNIEVFDGAWEKKNGLKGKGVIVYF